MADEMIPLHVCKIIPVTDGSVAIILGENTKGEEEGRHFLMCIGPFEAQAISLALQGVTTPRPMTHDLIMSILDGFGARLRRAVIVGVRNNTFIGTATIRSNEKDPATDEYREVVIDCRPSDLIALAVRADLTVEIAPHVLDLVAKGSVQELLDVMSAPPPLGQSAEDPNEEGEEGAPPA